MLTVKDLKNIARTYGIYNINKIAKKELTELLKLKLTRGQLIDCDLLATGSCDKYLDVFNNPDLVERILLNITFEYHTEHDNSFLNCILENLADINTVFRKYATSMIKCNHETKNFSCWECVCKKCRKKLLCSKNPQPSDDDTNSYIIKDDSFHYNNEYEYLNILDTIRNGIIYHKCNQGYSPVSITKYYKICQYISANEWLLDCQNEREHIEMDMCDVLKYFILYGNLLYKKLGHVFLPKMRHIVFNRC